LNKLNLIQSQLKKKEKKQKILMLFPLNRSLAVNMIWHSMAMKLKMLLPRSLNGLVKMTKKLLPKKNLQPSPLQIKSLKLVNYLYKRLKSPYLQKRKITL